MEKMIFIKRASPSWPPFRGIGPRVAGWTTPLLSFPPGHNSTAEAVSPALIRLWHSLAAKAYPLFLLAFFCASPSQAAVNLLSPAGGATGVFQSPALAAADLAQTEVRYPGTRWIMRYETQNVPLISVTGQES